MKKVFFSLIIVLISLGGCTSQDSSKDIVVGASVTPHAEILEAARTEVESAGYNLKVEVYDDYVMPNKALENGDIDANYFQHEPYLEQQEAEFGYDFSNVADIHVEPIRIYAHDYQKLNEIPDGATIAMSNSIADHARVLAVLEEEGLISFKPGVNKSEASFEDIDENKKNLKFEYDYEASLLPTIYQNNEADLVAINTNYALGAGIPVKEAIISEGDDSPYANILVVRKEDEESEKTKVLKSALTSEHVKTFIKNNYDGAVIPVEN